MSLLDTKIDVVQSGPTLAMTMPPRRPMALDGVTMVMGPVRPILPPTRRNTPRATSSASSRFGSGGEGEIFDGELCLEADDKRRAIEQDKLGAAVGARRDRLIGSKIDGDAPRLARRIVVERRADADAGGGRAGGQGRHRYTGQHGAQKR